jgi:uncharacterized protein YcaQ
MLRLASTRGSAKLAAVEPLAPVKLTQRQLRAHALLHTFAEGPTLRAVIERLEFVQADPIRAPARARDLILRQRLAGYRAGDLERHYPALDIEEGYLYAYGFLTRSLWQLRHRPTRAGSRAASDACWRWSRSAASARRSSAR